MNRYFWRCLCGGENSPVSLDCKECSKQRWSHLGWSRERACEVLDKILPIALAKVIA